MNVKIPFIISLHRPLSQPLKAVKWVCQFINHSRNIKPSQTNLEFYLYLVTELYKKYKANDLQDYNGIPSKFAIHEVYLAIYSLKKEEKILMIQNAISQAEKTALQKQIFSTYKAASYFVNMTKDKLGLIDANNELTEDAYKLLMLKSSFFKLSKGEKEFFKVKLLEKDFLMLVSLCLFQRLAHVKKIKNIVEIHYDFLDKYYGIRNFHFVSESLSNYNTVRTYWISSLNLLNKNYIPSPSFKKTIQSNSQFEDWYNVLNNRFEQYLDLTFKKNSSFLIRKERFESNYKFLLSKSLDELGFVNIHDLREAMKMSMPNFEAFLNEYYETEKSKKHIFLSNIVSSIDRRKRFKVRSTPVIKIRIKGI
ncbi:hypothetical protein [Pedobacter sp. R20-19]|uniref:hypothetical protein n=1 Tax=Pedobacter sp. R20-19 TaxID=1270196 RepID=UPI00049308A2|nr:hypothetical protein [Pedobacter sp. R20-19]